MMIIMISCALSRPKISLLNSSISREVQVDVPAAAAGSRQTLLASTAPASETGEHVRPTPKALSPGPFDVRRGARRLARPGVHRWRGRSLEPFWERAG